jgi:hypothetical protein
MQWLSVLPRLARRLALAGGLGALSVSLNAAGLPSRLLVQAPSASAPEPVLTWTHPFVGWQYNVESRAVEGGAWLPAPGGALLTGKTWTETRLEDVPGRLYRVQAVPPAGVRGRVISKVKTQSFSISTLNFLLALQGVPLTAQYNVEFYRVTYETIDPFGAPTTATMALAVPVVANRRWPLLAYAHGTVFEKTDVPSAANNEGLLGVILATSGYVAVLPDYLGLGDSPGAHPYHHAASTATSMVDGLRAARLVAGTDQVGLNGQLFLAGYSQGGHAIVATLRELEARHAAEFPVTACVAGAGAYDLSGVTLDDALSARVAPNPSYFVYALKMVADLYQVGPNFADLLQAPYATTVPPLLDGTKGGTAVNLALPVPANLAIKPAVLAALRTDPAHPIRLALADNDLTGFKPLAPLRLFHCSGDQDVLPANTQVALARFQALGATQVQASDPAPGANHSDCVQPALLAAKAWFDTLRQ